MLIDDHTRFEQEPPEGGIFLPQNYREEIEVLVGSYEEVATKSRRARELLREVSSEDDEQKYHNFLYQTGDRINRFVNMKKSEAYQRQDKVIELREPDKAKQKMIKQALRKDTREVFPAERQKWKEWLGTKEDQEKVLREHSIVLDVDPPPALLVFGIAYREWLHSESAMGADMSSRMSQLAHELAGTLLKDYPDFAGTIGRHHYESQLNHLSKKPYLVRCGEVELHFTDMELDNYTGKRHAGTIDYLTFLEDYIL